MPKRGILIALTAMLAMAGIVRAQEGLGQRLSVEHLGDIDTGAYTASNGTTFVIGQYAENYVLRFTADPETYVLYVDHASLGGRVLKYDSGETALAVSGWGAVTIYTAQAPGGLPADRTVGPGRIAPPPQLSLTEMQKAAADEAAHIAYSRGLHIAFIADWAALTGDAALRALTFDAMQNAARGLDRFAAGAAARAAVAAHMDSVQMVWGGRPNIALRGRTLQVIFSPTRGYEGRLSSHAIAHELGRIMALPTAG